MFPGDIDPYLVSRLGEPVQTGGLEVRFHCPCDDCVQARRDGKNDAKLYVNFGKGVYYCMRSNEGGPIKKLYASVGLDYSPEVKVPANLRDVVGFLNNDQKVEVASSKVQSVGIEVPETTSEWGYSDAWEWLTRRLVTVPQEELQELIERKVIRRGVGRYWDRIFFVDMYEDKARYWTARTYVEGLMPKYLNPYNIPRSGVMGNLDVVEQEYQDEVIICEGAISAIVAGKNAVWTYGRCVTREQIELLDTLNCSRFILVSEPDRDAKQNTMELARSLTKIRRVCYIVDMPTEIVDGKVVQHDPASLGRPRFRQLVEDSAVRFSWSTEVLRRLTSCP